MHLLAESSYRYIFNHPSILKKIKILNKKISLHSIGDELINRLCLLDKSSIMNAQDLVTSTEGNFITPEKQVIDTKLLGYEYVLIQNLLAISLGISLPITGACNINYGLSVIMGDNLCQAFEKITWMQRIKNQLAILGIKSHSNEIEVANSLAYDKSPKSDYFPIYNLPKDACFVIRNEEIEKIINIKKHKPSDQSPSTRISTPVSRLLWLACKNNEAISPLIRQPYKLLSIFEQWASAEGITDRLSGDTLKAALERGSPQSISPSN